ncbi:hypothetical protein GCM10027294_52820 [Marinactinospora endophytica]
MTSHTTNGPGAPHSDADVVHRALERAHSDLPPEGVTIEAADEASMREELFAVLLDDAEHPWRAA